MCPLHLCGWCALFHLPVCKWSLLISRWLFFWRSLQTFGRGYQNAEDAKGTWFLACPEDHGDIPEPANDSGSSRYSGNFKLRMPKSLHELLVLHVKKWRNQHEPILYVSFNQEWCPAVHQNRDFARSICEKMNIETDYLSVLHRRGVLNFEKHDFEIKISYY